jgi:hypothetical protein
MKRYFAILFAFLLASSECFAQTAFPPTQAGYSLVSRGGFAGTLLTQNAYTTVSTSSITTGISEGPVGAWDVTVEFIWSLTGTNANSYPCIIGTAGTGAAGSQDSFQSVVCNGSPSGQLAGSILSGNVALQNVVVYSATYPNNTVVSFSCKINTTLASASAYGFCSVRGNPI